MNRPLLGFMGDAGLGGSMAFPVAIEVSLKDTGVDCGFSSHATSGLEHSGAEELCLCVSEYHGA